MPMLSVTLDEAWALHIYVRQHDRLGWEHERVQQKRLHAVLAALRDQGPDATCDLECDEEYLWWADRQVPVNHQVGVKYVGRDLLEKVQDALLALDSAVPSCEGPLPTSFAKWGAEEEDARSVWAVRQGEENS